MIIKNKLPNLTSELVGDSSEVKSWFSAKEIEMLGLASVARLPGTERGARDKMKREGWTSKRVQGKGGKGGIKTEYQPPSNVLAIIHNYLKDNPDFFEKNKSSAVSSNHYPISTANPLTTGSGEHSGLTIQSHSGTDNRVNNFVTLPKYTLQTMPDLIIRSEQVVDHLAFNKDWLEGFLNIYDNSLALIRVKDDSMEPTLKSDDLILTELSQGNIDGDSIYVLRFDNDLILRRIQRKMNGSLLMIADNEKYKPEEIDHISAKDLPVIGKVLWYGRRI